MSQTILEIVEDSLINIATRYREFSSNSDVLPVDLKDFDEQLNDIMDRYNKLKGLQSTYTAEELTIKLNEFSVLYDDIVSKVQNGYFNGQDGINGKDFTFDMFTLEQLALLKGQNGSDGNHGLDGDNGLNAYEIALNNGFVGSETLWLESLKGQNGSDGINGADGQNGTNGIHGKSAYEIALDNGFVGSQTEWIESLKGQDGANGIDGINGQDGAVTFESLTPEQIALLKGENGLDGQNGIDGTNGADGQNGTNGTNGIDGKSAYQIALDNGFVGSQTEWLESLKGQNGSNGIDGTNGQDGILDFNSLTTEQKQEIANLIPVSSGGSSAENLISLVVKGVSSSLGYLVLHTKIKFHHDVIFTINSKISKDSFANQEIGFFYESRGSHKRIIRQSHPNFVVSSYYDIDGNLNIVIPYTPNSLLNYFSFFACLPDNYDNTVSYSFAGSVPPSTLNFNAYYLANGL